MHTLYNSKYEDIITYISGVFHRCKIFSHSYSARPLGEISRNDIIIPTLKVRKLRYHVTNTRSQSNRLCSWNSNPVSLILNLELNSTTA